MSGAAYAIQDGSYVKVGKHVFFWGHFRLSVLANGGTHHFSITGLPYVSADADAAVALNYDALTGSTAGHWPVVGTGFTWVAAAVVSAPSWLWKGYPIP